MFEIRCTLARAGVWRKSTDGGSSWIASNTGLTNFFVLSLAIDPLTPATIYAGALENPGYNWTGAVFKSIDGGGTWTELGLRDYISELLIDPQNSNIIYAANSGRVLKSTDAGDSWSPLNGLPTGLYSITMDSTSSTTLHVTTRRGVFTTTDGGETWSNIDVDFTPIAFAVDPTTPSTFYAGSVFEGCF